MAVALVRHNGHTDGAADWVHRLSAIVEAIGLASFGTQLLAYADQLIGADHCTIFQLKDYRLTEVACAPGRSVLAVPEAYLKTYEVNRRFQELSSSQTRVDLYRLSGPTNCRSIAGSEPQGILVLGKKQDALYCVRILRLAQPCAVPEAGLSQLREVADLLISLVARHQSLFVAKPSSTAALASLRRTEEGFLNTKRLSRREAEVCARILFGYTSCGIAADLGIGKESVMTYRKRAYQHLGIGSQRELMLWYLEQSPGDAAAAFLPCELPMNAAGQFLQS